MKLVQQQNRMKLLGIPKNKNIKTEDVENVPVKNQSLSLHDD